MLLSAPALLLLEVGLEPEVDWFSPVAVAELAVLVLSAPEWSLPVVELGVLPLVLLESGWFISPLVGLLP